MASFSTAYDQHIQPNEGYYAFLKGDKGGQTYGGIARNYFPNWVGWKTVDFFVDRDYNGNPQAVPNNKHWSELDTAVRQFFLTQFWDPNNMSLVRNQDVANIIFDWQVNSGSKTANKQVQQIVGVAADGIFGPNTLNAINNWNAAKLNNAIKEARAEFYSSLADADKFLAGWLNRLNNFPTLPVVGAAGVLILVGLALLLYNYE